MTAAIPADSLAGVALLALRAGPLTTDEVAARWGRQSGPALALHDLARAGLAVKTGNTYRITRDGRAACPFRNATLAAKAAERQGNPAMSSKKTDAAVIIATIDAAGPGGIGVKALAEKLGVCDRTIFYAVRQILGGPVRKLSRGIYTAARFLDREAEGGGDAGEKPAAACNTGVPEEEVARIAREYEEMIDFEVEPAGAVPGPVDRVEDLVRQSWEVIDLQTKIDNLLVALNASTAARDAAEARVRDLKARLSARESAPVAGARYAIAFPSDLYGDADSAVAQAVLDYEHASLNDAIVVTCTPVGRIASRPVFVPAGSE